MSHDTRSGIGEYGSPANAAEEPERLDSRNAPAVQELLFETALALIIPLAAALAAQLTLSPG